MSLDSPLDVLHRALSSACYKDLPDIVYHDRDWDAYKTMTDQKKKQSQQSNTMPTVTKYRRPETYDVEIVMFPQTWGSTALGFGGIGGAAMTSAYTVIVTYANHNAVYFSGRLAYVVDLSNKSQAGIERWQLDLARHDMAEVSKAGRYQ